MDGSVVFDNAKETEVGSAMSYDYGNMVCKLLYENK